MNIEVVENNKDEILNKLDAQIDVALEAAGLQVESYAKKEAPVDTGLLRNSITHALAGKPASISTYHAQFGSARTATGKRQSASSKKAGAVGFGAYSGVAPDEGEKAVYIGTNVEYAPYVEFGARGRPAKHFLRNALFNHTTVLKRIVESYLKG